MVVVNPRFELQITTTAGATVKCRGLESAELRMSRERPADELKLNFPTHKRLTLGSFRDGDVVDFSLGFKELGVYPGFHGVVTEVGPNLPLTLKCESQGGRVRFAPYSTTYVEKTWKEIAADAMARAGLEPVLSDYKTPTDAPKKFRVDGQTPGEVLAKCAEETGWTWYDIAGTGKAWFGPRYQEPESEGRTFKFIVGQNVFSDGCELKYNQDRRVKRVVVTLTDSEYKVAAAVGEFKAPDYRDGDAEKKLSFSVSNPTVKNAEARAEEEYLKLSTTGLEGSFTAVGNPLIRPGRRIIVVNPKLDDVERHATVEEVTHNLGGGEYVMTLKIAGGYEE
jgi:hypothetical protein